MTLNAPTAFRILADAYEAKAHEDLDRALALRRRAQHLETNMPQNTLQVLAPYYCDLMETWVFDDPTTELVREPFVNGIPEMIDDLVKDIPDARDGFRMIFSPTPFPGYQRRLNWVREEFGGNWYKIFDDEALPTRSRPAVGLPPEGWLCPALFKYFAAAPREIYVKAEQLA